MSLYIFLDAEFTNEEKCKELSDFASGEPSGNLANKLNELKKVVESWKPCNVKDAEEFLLNPIVRE